MSPIFLQTAIFITGCAGIVAEYVLSTLATYLLGNGVFQWTMVMSLMLFAMGLGSRVSRYLKDDLFDFFLLSEFCLSVLCSLAAVVSYSVAAYVDHSFTALIIYTHSMLIGMFIGMEIPLVTRINDNYTSLRINISSVMEKDYYGALIGGVFFVFIALPYFGMTYTPVILGTINFFVALMLILTYYPLIKYKKIVLFFSMLSVVSIVMIFLFSKSVILYSEQKQYTDKIIFAEQTKYQKIVMTRWKNNVWLYLNGQEQFSTYDEQRYHESLVHPVMKLASSRENILILGGGDGLAAREVLKYKDVKSIDLVDLDPAMTNLAKNYPVLTEINKGSMNDKKLHISNDDALNFIKNTNKLYNIIIADFPDPDTMDLMHLYSKIFYSNVKKHLAKGGVFVTQACSPFFSPRVFLSIRKTIASAGMSTLKYHQQIATMGDWGWVIAVDSAWMDEDRLKNKFINIDISDIPTRFLTKDILDGMIKFAKDVFFGIKTDKIKINTMNNPVLYQYYNKGRWDIY